MGAGDSLWNRIADIVSDRLLGRILPSDDLAKADSAGGSQIPPEATPSDPLALLSDPFALLETLGYRERYSPVSYEMLARMAYHVPIFPSIMQTRRNQVAAFALPAGDEALPGFRIGLRERKRKIGRREEQRCQELTEWVVTTGSSQSLGRDTFGTFLRKVVRDGLIWDQSCFEIVRNKKDIPCDFYAVDGSSIRIADSEWRHGIPDDDQVRYVQVHDESVIAEFTPRQLCFGVRNPRSDLRCNGYGESELEIGIKIATALVNGFTYNSQFFQHGTVAKGMLNLPRVPDHKLRIFARQWHMVASGMMNAWRTPITNFEDAKWISLQQNNRDMEWSAFIDFLIKLFSGICQIDPTELNFLYGNSGQTSQMFQSPTEQKVKHSKDKGLRPLLDSIAEWLNRYLIWQIDPDLCFYFTGLDPRESETQVGIESKQVRYLKTVNELRAENDLKPLDPEQGDIILDPQWMQAWQQQQMMKQQEQQQAIGQQGEDQGGQPGDEQPEASGQQGGQPGGQPGGQKPPAWQQLLPEDSKSLRHEIEI